jgi:glutamate synthase domain-containing protein 3
MGMVELFPVRDEQDISELRSMVEKHYRYTHSTVARQVLENWDKVVGQFVKIYPRDYRRVIEEKTKPSMKQEPTLAITADDEVATGEGEAPSDG